MPALPSTMLPLGTQAPDFALPDTEGRTRTASEFRGSKALVVLFICNHCPYVKHIRAALAEFGREYLPKGVAVVAINSNDPAKYPSDAPELMKAEAEEAGYTFPYLFDATQEVAKAYQAACTPDLYVFDGEQKLAYRGQADESRPSNGKPVTFVDLRAACDAILSGQPVSVDQKPSIGCSIKWRPGNEPDYYG